MRLPDVPPFEIPNAHTHMPPLRPGNLLDGLGDYRWALFALSAVLFFDVVLQWGQGHGLLAWQLTRATLGRELGWLLAMLAAFAVTCALLMPLASVCLRLLLVPLFDRLRGESEQPDAVLQRAGEGFVLSTVVLSAALQSGDAQLLRWHQDHVRWYERRAQVALLGYQALFTCVVLACIDAWGMPTGTASPSLVDAALASLGELRDYVMVGALLVLVIACRGWFTSSAPIWILHPLLAEQVLQDAADAAHAEALAQR